MAVKRSSPQYCLDYEEHGFEHFMEEGVCPLCNITLQDFFSWQAGLWEAEDAQGGSQVSLPGTVTPINGPSPRVGRVERFVG